MTTHYKAAKKSTPCSHIHLSRTEAKNCTELGKNPGVIACFGPGGVIKRIAIQIDGDDAIDLPSG